MRNYEDLIRISEMLYSITKIDVRLNNESGDALFQLVSHPLPVALDYLEHDLVQIHEVLTKHQPNYFYHYINTFGLDYVAVGIWRSASFYGSIVVGPFISSSSIIDLIKDIIVKNNLPISERKQLEEFYQALPVLSEIEYKNIGEMLINLCGKDLVPANQISSDTVNPILNLEQLVVSIEENKDIIEERYEQQNKLMIAISRGDKAEVNRLLHSMADILVFSDRIPGSPIRASKNIGFVLNTLYRIAAERSGVHPVYLHNISERYAILIERASNIPNLQKLVVLMSNDYCDLVNTYSTGKFSPIVKKAMNFILLNLGHPLTLNHIANEIHANPSHLSRKFKEDTGLNVTEYINQKRIEEAKLYLQRGNSSITDVAFMVGFNDLNYFSKVFKKLTSETPSAYVKRRNK